MKILLISPFFSPDVGGVETMLSNFCNFLASEKHDVIVLTYSPLIARKKAKFKEKINDKVLVIRIPWIGFGLFNIFEKYAILQFFYLVPVLTISALFLLFFSKKRPDIIHSFGLSAAFAGGLASRIFNISSIVDMCTVYRFPERKKIAWFVKILLNMSDYIRGNNLPGKEELIGIGIEENKLGIITPPVDEQIFKPMSQIEARKVIGVPSDKFVALFVGRMVHSKNVDIAINASLLVKNPNVSFVFVGDGPLKFLVEEAAKKDKRIIVANSVNHHDLVYYYNAGDILMCGAVDKNLISFVGRESLMCGLPILALDVATYAGISYDVDSDLIPQSVGFISKTNAEAVAFYLDDIVSKKEKENVLPFDRNACVEFGIENFSQNAMNWIGDSYEKAKTNNTLRKKRFLTL